MPHLHFFSQSLILIIALSYYHLRQDTSFGYQRVGPAVAANALGLTTVTSAGSTPFIVVNIVVPGNSKPTWPPNRAGSRFESL